jgi:hypothetical protein
LTSPLLASTFALVNNSSATVRPDKTRMARNALFQRAGVGRASLALKAHEPNPSEGKELQLANVNLKKPDAGCSAK